MRASFLGCAVHLSTSQKVQYHNLPLQKSPVAESPTSKQSSTTISHSKKVQQQNLPQQNSPVLQSPTAKKSSSRISHLKIVQYHNLPHQNSPVAERLKEGRCILFFLSQSQSFISVFLPCQSIRSIIDFQFGHGSQSKIQYQNLFLASCLRGCRMCPDFCKSVNPISTRP